MLKGGGWSAIQSVNSDGRRARMRRVARKASTGFGSSHVAVTRKQGRSPLPTPPTHTHTSTLTRGSQIHAQPFTHTHSRPLRLPSTRPPHAAWKLRPYLPTNAWWRASRQPQLTWRAPGSQRSLFVSSRMLRLISIRQFARAGGALRRSLRNDMVHWIYVRWARRQLAAPAEAVAAPGPSIG